MDHKVSVGKVLGQNITVGISRTSTGTGLDCTLSVGLLLGK